MASEFLRLKSEMPVLGVGLGLRGEICEATFDHKASIDFLEFTPENYRANNATINWLASFAEQFPLVSHSVSLSIGSIDPLDKELLKATRFFLKNFKLKWWSDHLCFSGVDGMMGNDLFPLPWTEETVRHVARRVREAQEQVEAPLILENIPYYSKMPVGDFDEAEFLSQVLEESDCGLLLDINNLFVNSINHGFDPKEFLDRIPLERTVQIHLAGPGKFGNRIIDTHGSAVPDPVFDLLDYVLSKHVDPKAIMIERDQYFPDFAELLQELEQIKAIWKKYVMPAKSLTEPESAINLSTHADLSSAPPPAVAELASLPIAHDSVKGVTSKRLDSPKKLGKDSIPGTDRKIAQHDLAGYERKWFTLWNDLIGSDPISTDAKNFMPRFARTHDKTEGYDVRSIGIYSWLRDSNRDSLMRRFFPACFILLQQDWEELLLQYFHTFQNRYNDNAKMGDRFPEFLRRHGRQYQAVYPFIFELAEFEQLKQEAGRSHQYTDFSGDVYLGATEQIKAFKPLVNPELMLKSFIYPVGTICEAVKNGEQYNSSPNAVPEAIAFMPRSWTSKVLKLDHLSLWLIDRARRGSHSYSQLIAEAMSSEQRSSAEAIASYIRRFQELHDEKIFTGCIPCDFKNSWAEYGRAVANEESHATIQLALSKFEQAQKAIDLGCGSGRDTKEMLKRGWNVFAVDQSQDALNCLTEARGTWSTEQLETWHGKMQDANLPEVSLINAGVSLPFCPPEDFAKLWANVLKALKPGGIFSGHFFGKNDDWSVNQRMTFFSLDEVKKLFDDFEFEWLNEIEGPIPIVPTGFRHGQVFEIVARKRT